jgi:hypothetical protein
MSEMRKWSRNEKRNMIINKINELQYQLIEGIRNDEYFTLTKPVTNVVNSSQYMNDLNYELIR